MRSTGREGGARARPRSPAVVRGGRGACGFLNRTQPLRISINLKSAWIRVPIGNTVGGAYACRRAHSRSAGTRLSRSLLHRDSRADVVDAQQGLVAAVAPRVAVVELVGAL